MEEITLSDELEAGAKAILGELGYENNKQELVRMAMNYASCDYILGWCRGYQRREDEAHDEAQDAAWERGLAEE